MPLNLDNYFNDLNENGGPIEAAAKGFFCRKPAVFAGEDQLAEAASGENFSATPFMQ